MIFSKVRQSQEWAARCDSWLSQFSSGERATAELLLDSINYITHEDVCKALAQSCNDLLERLVGPCALYPITNTADFAPFESYSDMPFGVDGDLGSEGDLGHLCRDISQSAHAGPALAFPTLEKMRQEKVRHIILLTDTTSSGQQGVDYLDWLWACRTIRSWHSGRFVDFHYITFLYAMDGLDTVRAHRCQPESQGLQACDRGHPSWSPEQRESVEALCRKYGGQKWPLGYADMLSLQVFSYSCPNNVPSILRYGSRKTGFRGLFERRPTNVSGHAISGSEENVGAVAAWLGLRSSSAEAVVCYALLSRPATPDTLSARLGLQLTIINRALNASLDAGHVQLLRHAHRLTPAGRRFARSLYQPAATERRPVPTPGSRFDYCPQPWSPAASSSNASDQEAPNE